MLDSDETILDSSLTPKGLTTSNGFSRHSDLYASLPAKLKGHRKKKYKSLGAIGVKSDEVAYKEFLSDEEGESEKKRKIFSLKNQRKQLKNPYQLFNDDSYDIFNGQMQAPAETYASLEATKRHPISDNLQYNEYETEREEKETASANLYQDDALNILKELDAILDTHGATSSLCFDMDLNIKNCLYELDNYLEKMDASLDTNSGNFISPMLETNLQGNEIEQLEEAVVEPGTNTVHQREISLPYQENKVSGSNESVDTLSQRKPNLDISNQLLDITKPQPAIGLSAKSTNELLVALHKPHTSQSRNTELRRCFSQSELRHNNQNNNFLSQPSEMLTEATIFNNILLQSELDNQTENRPRQFGRRAEGHPLIVSLTMENNTGANQLNNQNRPVSAPVATNRRSMDHVTPITCQETQFTPYNCSEVSSIRSSRNTSPVSLASSTDSSLTVGSIQENISSRNLVENNNVQNRNTISMCDNQETSFNNIWPNCFSRISALICCTLGLLNICRFAVLTINYGGNFLIQFFILSLFFGIPLFWLQMCLGAKIKSGPVSMWKISPICKGIGITLVLIQCLLAIYSTVAIAWVLVYLRDSFSNETNAGFFWERNGQQNMTNFNLTESIADYFNVKVLQRIKHANVHTESRFQVNDRLAFHLAFIWTVVFLVLSKGLKSFGNVVLVLITVPLMSFLVVSCKFLIVIGASRLQSIFSASDFDDFLINSKTWAAAAQETFFTWSLLGASVISITSRSYVKESKTALRRDAILVVLITFICLFSAAMLGLACDQILKEYNYIYVPGTFENIESSFSIYSLKSSLNPNLLSFPSKWIPHYSSFVGDTYRRPNVLPHSQSGYQALRFVSELLPAVISLTGNSMSWIWISVLFITLMIIGFAQLCAIWKPISCALGNSTSSVLLSCVTALLISIPFATEVGISILHYMDLVLGGSWFIPILWVAQIFGVFLIRGRPYNGDDLVNDLKLPSTLSAFLALSWNVLLPFGLIALAVINYKISLTSQYFYWKGRSYFNNWTKQVGALTQISLLLLVPIVAIIQICRYLNKGPPDILDRIQLLYRPTNDSHVGNHRSAARRDIYNERLQAASRIDLNETTVHRLQDDEPPKYTPPPSYTTATGARLAKILRESIRRILREPRRNRPILTDVETMNQERAAIEVPNLPTNQAEQNRVQLHNEATNLDWLTTRSVHTSLSLGRNLTSRKNHLKNDTQRSLSASRAIEMAVNNHNAQIPFTAEDVVSVLRPSMNLRLPQEESAEIFQQSQELNNLPPRENVNSFRSIENLISNEQPIGESPAMHIRDQNLK